MKARTNVKNFIKGVSLLFVFVFLSEFLLLILLKTSVLNSLLISIIPLAILLVPVLVILLSIYVQYLYVDNGSFVHKKLFSKIVIPVKDLSKIKLTILPNPTLAKSITVIDLLSGESSVTRINPRNFDAKTLESFLSNLMKENSNLIINKDVFGYLIKNH